MTFPRIRAPGMWVLGSVIAPAEMEDFDQHQFHAVDGFGGGAYAPTSRLVFGGSGTDFTGGTGADPLGPLTSTAASGSGASGIVAVGDGAGYGGKFTGGASGGLGVIGTGGSAGAAGVLGVGAAGGTGVEAFGGSNAAGVDARGGNVGNTVGVLGQGHGSGSGMVGTGGTSGGPGVKGFGGGSNSTGVYGEGTGTGPGVEGLGEANGRGGQFFGGPTNGTGVLAEGGGTSGIGLDAIGQGAGTVGPAVRATAAHGAVTDVAVEVASGTIFFSGSQVGALVDPGANNVLSAANTPKFWGVLRTDGAGNVGIVDGYNFATVTIVGGGTNSSHAVVTFARSMADDKYAVMATAVSTDTNFCTVASKSSAGFSVYVFERVSLNNTTARDLAAIVIDLMFVGMGRQ